MSELEIPNLLRPIFDNSRAFSITLGLSIHSFVELKDIRPWIRKFPYELEWLGKISMKRQGRHESWVRFREWEK